MLEAEITPDGDAIVEGENIGKLEGLRFSPDPSASSGSEAKTVRAAAQKALASEIEKRAERIAKAPNEAFVLSSDYTIRWLGAVIARVTASDDFLAPNFIVLADDQLTGPAQEKVTNRLRLWLDNQVATVLQPLVDLRKAEGLEGLSRGIAFQLAENFGVIDRREIANDIQNLDQTARGSLRKLGVRFGAYHIFIPILLKPAPASLVAMLWGLKEEQTDNPGISEVPSMSAAGRTSFESNPEIPADLYRVAGFKVSGGRAVRVDILERLADIIRPLISWKPSENDPTPPEGALNEFGFTVTVAMTSLLGCSGDNFATVLKSLGYRVERREIPVEEAPATEAVSEEAPNELPSEISEVPEIKADETPSAETSEEPPESADGETTEETGPQFLEIWRPQPANRGNANRPRENANKGGKGKPRSNKADNGGKGGGKGKRPPKSSKPDHAGKPKEKKIDPDSPFAKLAALKDGLKK